MMYRKIAKDVELRRRRATMDPCASSYNKISYVFSSVASDGPLYGLYANLRSSEIFDLKIVLKILTRSSMPLYKGTSSTLFRHDCGMER